MFESRRACRSAALAVLVLVLCLAPAAAPAETLVNNILVPSPGLSSATTESAAWPIVRAPALLPPLVAFQPELADGAAWYADNGYPVCVLFRSVTFEVHDDETVDEVNHVIYRLNNRLALEQWGETPLWFDPTFQTFTLNEARVHTASGELRELEPQHVRLRDGNTDYRVYNDNRQVVLSFPGLEVGDCVEYRYTIHEQYTAWGPRFAASVVLNRPVGAPVLRSEMQVRLPPGQELQSASFGAEITPQVSTDDNGSTYVWRWGPLTGPAEEAVSQPTGVQVGVSCSTYASWDEVAAWWQSRTFARAECTEEIRQQVNQLVAGRGTETAKAQALAAWVRDSIRNRGDATGPYLAQPHAPAETFANRYGACWDKSLLLATMLEEAGLVCAFAYVNTDGVNQIDARVPSPSVNHAFLAVWADGAWHWVDTTATWNGWDELRADCYARNTLLVGKERFVKTTTPQRTADTYRIETTSDVTLEADGSAAWKVERAYQRLAATEARSRWIAATALEIDRDLLTECRECYPQSRLARAALERAALSNADAPLTVSFALEVPQMFAGEEARKGVLYDALMFPYLKSMAPNPELQAPLIYDKPFELVHVLRLHLPEGQSLDRLPLGGHIQSRWGMVDLAVETAAASRELRLTWRFRVEQPWVEPADLREFGQFRDAAIQLLGAAVEFRPDTPQAPDGRAAAPTATAAQ